MATSPYGMGINPSSSVLRLFAATRIRRLPGRCPLAALGFARSRWRGPCGRWGAKKIVSQSGANRNIAEMDCCGEVVGNGILMGAEAPRAGNLQTDKFKVSRMPWPTQVRFWLEWDLRTNSFGARDESTSSISPHNENRVVWATRQEPHRPYEAAQAISRFLILFIESPARRQPSSSPALDPDTPAAGWRIFG